MNLYRAGVVVGFVGCLMLSGCGSSGGGGGGGGGSTPAPHSSIACSSPGNPCNIVLTDSGGHLSSSMNVDLFAAAVTGSCASGTYSPASLSFPGSSGSVALNFTINPAAFGANPADFAIYLDLDRDQRLSNGDLVWGVNGPSGVMGVACYANVSTALADIPYSLDWTAVGNATFGGVSVWGGGLQTFSAPGVFNQSDMFQVMQIDKLQE